MSRETQLLMLGVALNAWRDAQDSAIFATQHETVSDGVFNGLCVGVVTLYARPFTKNTGIAKLPSEFSTFPNNTKGQKRKDLHFHLLNLRNQVFAHYDVPENSKRFPNADKIIIQSKNESELKIFWEAILIDRERIPAVIDLFEFQQIRLRNHFRRALRSTFGAKIPSGVFLLSKDGISPTGDSEIS